MVGCFGDGSKPILHMDLSCFCHRTYPWGNIQWWDNPTKLLGFPYGTMEVRGKGQKLHELSIPIVPTNMVICCNSMVYLLNIVISYRNVGLPEGTSHLSQWIPIYIYIYTIESAVSEKFHWYPIKWTLGFPPHIQHFGCGFPHRRGGWHQALPDPCLEGWHGSHLGSQRQDGGAEIFAEPDRKSMGNLW